jgi:hypothetical protein
MTKASLILDELEKQVPKWKKANAAAEAPSATDEEKTAFKKIDEAFVNLRSAAEPLVNGSSSLEEKNRFQSLRHPRVMKDG